MYKYCIDLGSDVRRKYKPEQQ